MTEISSLALPIARWLLATALHSAVLIALVSAALLLAGRRITPAWRHALWLIVVVRLCLPWAPASPVRFAGLLPFTAFPAGGGSSGSDGESAVVVIQSSSLAGEAEKASPAGLLKKPAVTGAALAARPIRGESAPSWAAWLAAVWLLGCVIGLVRLALAIRKHTRLVAGLRPVEDAALLRLLESCASALRVRKLPLLLSGAGVSAPALLGLFRPRILLPTEIVSRWSADELRPVLLHELAHLKRRDVAVNWLLAALRIVHWMNPLLPWAFRRLREERELAADELVLARSGEPDGRRYGQALIRILESGLARLPVPALAVGAPGDPRFLERRILRISEFRRGARRGPILGCVLLAGCSLGVLDPAGGGVPSERVVRTYDVSAILRSAHDYEAPRLGVSTSRSKEEVANAEALHANAVAQQAKAAREAKARKLEEIAARIRAEGSPGGWDTGNEIAAGEDSITVTAPEAVQEAVRMLIDRLNAEHGIMVKIQVRFLETRESGLERLPAGLAAKLRQAAAPDQKLAVPLSPEEMDELTDAISIGTARIREESRIVSFNRQSSYMLIVKQQKIIADAGRVEVDGKEEVEPVVRILNLGVTCQVRAMVSEDRRRLTLDLELQTLRRKGPIQDIIEDDIPAAVPELRTMTLARTIEISPREWVLVPGTRAATGEEPGELVLVSAEILSPQGEEEKGAEHEDEGR